MILLRAAWRYRWFSLVLVSIMTSLTLLLSGKPAVANILLLSAVIAACLPVFAGLMSDIRHGRYGVNVLALIAAIASLLLKEFWTAALVVLMITGGKIVVDYAQRRSRQNLSSLTMPEASRSQAPFVKLAGSYSLPFSLIIIAIASTVWLLSGDPHRFLEVMVVASPGPLLLAAPLAVNSGLSRASGLGILIRSGTIMERLAAARAVVFNKTGILTEGRLRLTDTAVYHDFTDREVISAVASLEAGSDHIIAQAIAAANVGNAAKLRKVKHYTEIKGFGITGSVMGRPVLVGQRDLMDDNKVTMPPRFRSASIKQTAAYVAIDGRLAGIITFEDTIREDSPLTLAALRKLGIEHIEMLTGDNKAAAAEAASQLGITQVVSEATPADKVAAIKAIRERPVVFVGDRVNDAPALAAADIGIAVGTSELTTDNDSADIVIMADDISRVALAREVARRTFQIARRSILIGISLSILLMIIFASGRFAALYGAVLQELVEITVLLSALRAHGGGHIRPGLAPAPLPAE